jgi:hypothetical protein
VSELENTGRFHTVPAVGGCSSSGNVMLEDRWTQTDQIHNDSTTQNDVSGTCSALPEVCHSVKYADKLETGNKLQDVLNAALPSTVSDMCSSSHISDGNRDNDEKSQSTVELAAAFSKLQQDFINQSSINVSLQLEIDELKTMNEFDNATTSTVPVMSATTFLANGTSHAQLKTFLTQRMARLRVAQREKDKYATLLHAKCCKENGLQTEINEIQYSIGKKNT